MWWGKNSARNLDVSWRRRGKLSFGFKAPSLLPPISTEEANPQDFEIGRGHRKKGKIELKFFKLYILFLEVFWQNDNGGWIGGPSINQKREPAAVASSQQKKKKANLSCPKEKKKEEEIMGFVSFPKKRRKEKEASSMIGREERRGPPGMRGKFFFYSSFPYNCYKNLNPFVHLFFLLSPSAIWASVSFFGDWTRFLLLPPSPNRTVIWQATWLFLITRRRSCDGVDWSRHPKCSAGRGFCFLFLPRYIMAATLDWMGEAEAQKIKRLIARAPP